MENQKKYSDELISSKQSKIISEEKYSRGEYKMAFSGHSDSYCVGLVDIIESTKISASYIYPVYSVSRKEKVYGWNSSKNIILF